MSERVNMWAYANFVICNVCLDELLHEEKKTSLFLNSNDELINRPEALIRPSLLGQDGVKLTKWPCSENCINRILKSLHEIYITSTRQKHHTKIKIEKLS